MAMPARSKNKDPGPGVFNQYALGELFPAMHPSFFNRVADQKTRQTSRRAIVKKNAHEVAG